MKSIELLVRENPNLSGKEISELYQKGVDEYKAAEARRNKEKLDLIDKINTKGLFVKGTFSRGDHKYFWRFGCASLEDNEIRCKVEKILLDRDSKDNRFWINIETKDYQALRTFDIENQTEITEKEYLEAKEKIENIFGEL